jgi:hypothetical protein
LVEKESFEQARGMESRSPARRINFVPCKFIFQI